MGIQSITERKEIQSGAVKYQTGFKVPDLSSAAAAGPASLGRALSGIGDGLKGISLALSKVDEADADAIVRDIRKYSDHVLNVGYTDPKTGVKEPGIAVDGRIDHIRGSANRHDALVNEYARGALDGANESVRRLVSMKTDEMRSQITHNLKKREVLGEAKFQHDNLVQDIQDRSRILVDSQLMKSRAMRSSPLEEHIVENVAAASASGRALDKGAVDRITSQSRNAGEAFGNDYLEGFDMLRSELESMKGGISHRLVTFCLNSQQDADNKADAMVKKAAADVVDALVKDGDYGRAKVYASQMDEFGFSEEQKSEMVKSVEKAERTEIARQEAENAKYLQKARSDAYNSYWSQVNDLYKNGGYNAQSVSQLKKELADSIEDMFPEYAAKERAEAHEIDARIAEEETRVVNANAVNDIVDKFNAETKEMIENEQLDDVNDPDRLEELANKISVYNEEYAMKIRSQAARERARRIDDRRRGESRSRNAANTPEQKQQDFEALREKGRQQVWRANEIAVGQAKIEYLKSLDDGTTTEQRQKKEEYDRAVTLALVRGAMDPKKQESILSERRKLEKDEIARAMGVYYSNWTVNDLGGKLLTKEIAEKRVEGMKINEQNNDIYRLYKVGQWLEDELERLGPGIYKPELVDALIKNANKKYATASFEESKKDIAENIANLRKGFATKAVQKSWILERINESVYVSSDTLDEHRQNNPYDFYSGDAFSEEYAMKNLDEREELASKHDEGTSVNGNAQEYDSYTVKDDEDLISISIELGISPSSLLDINGLDSTQVDEIKPGKVIKVPGRAKKLRAAL